MAKKEIKFERNQFGIAIRKCCASCALKEYTNSVKMLCSLNDEKVTALHVCRKWQMSEGMNNAGLGSGVVRHRATKEVIF